jgi:hypothetical protein
VPKRIKKPSKARVISSPKHLLLIPATLLLIKLIIIVRIQGLNWYAEGEQDLGKGLLKLLDSRLVPPNIWFGSDGENYVRGLLGLVQDGLFSEARNLYYWPAGYPILMWGITLLFKGNLFLALGILQSLFYAVVCTYFVEQLWKTRVRKIALPVALILSLNPTLALSSIVVGYESIVASCLLLSVALLISYAKEVQKNLLDKKIILAATSFSVASFLQPRVIALAIVFLVVWGLAFFRLKTFSLFLALYLSISFFTSGALALRNYKAMEFVAVSTNLGVTMNIGAGKGASGGYVNNPRGVVCPDPEDGKSRGEKNIAQQDSEVVKCVLKWYLKNPTESMRLFWNKTVFYWSPWFGPLANGTMGRNPWLEVHPLKETIKTQSGFEMVAGGFGKAVSWAWILGNVIFLFMGWRVLWIFGGIERLWGTSALAMILTNWLISLATIGDHRFRIPTMTLSLTLQVIGLFGFRLIERGSRNSQGEAVLWPLLHWKRKSETDNLLP